jgi:hypothetical protein
MRIVLTKTQLKLLEKYSQMFDDKELVTRLQIELLYFVKRNRDRSYFGYKEVFRNIIGHFNHAYSIYGDSYWRKYYLGINNFYNFSNFIRKTMVEYYYYTIGE